jgi:hypothetical protein
MLRWYNLTSKIRVCVNNDDLEFINKYKHFKKVSKQSLTPEEVNTADKLVQKSVFGRYKTDTETFYLFNR